MTTEGSSSSDDEDMPLSSLARRKTKKRPKAEEGDESDESEEAEFDFDEEENGADEEDKEDYEDDEDDEDDKPIASRRSSSRKRKSTTVTNISPTKKAKPKTKKTTPTKKKKKTPTPAKKSSPAKSKKSNSNSEINPSGALYLDSKKGKLIKELLCRWWYAITWPDPASIPKETPENCDALDGFPGVYVATSGHDIGKIIDFRDHTTSPNFKNMAKKSSDELKELLLKSIAEQRRILIENEGEGTHVEKDLKKLEKWTKGVNSKTADKEAKTVLKAAGFKLE